MTSRGMTYRSLSKIIVTWFVVSCTCFVTFRPIFGAAELFPAVGTESSHPTHVCRGEVDFNTDTQSLEFAVCLYEEDVRTLLRRRTDSKTDFTDQEKTGSVLEQYLRDNFWVATTDKEELPITWYGFERDKEGIWMYFEVPLNGNPEDLVIGNRMLLEIQPGNVSVFRFRWAEKRSNQLFNSQTVGQKLIWAAGRKQIEDSERIISLSLSESIDSQLEQSRAIVPSFDAPPTPRSGNLKLGN